MSAAPSTSSAAPSTSSAAPSASTGRHRSVPRWVTPALGIGALVFSAIAIVDGLWILGPTAEQGDYSKLLVVHPPVATIAYVAFGITALCSLLYLLPRTRRREWDQLAGASAEVGVVFCALTLVTGSIWGRPVWGVWWTWDARLTATALLLVLFLGYLALRRIPAEESVRGRRCAVAALIAILDVPVDHFATTWWQTLHQGSSIDLLQPDKHIDTSHNIALLFGFIAMTLAFAWLLVHRYRVEQLESRYEQEGLAVALEARRAEGGVETSDDAEDRVGASA
jgi:heme exporter protein C